MTLYNEEEPAEQGEMQNVQCEEKRNKHKGRADYRAPGYMSNLWKRIKESIHLQSQHVGGGGRWISDFKVSLVYRANSRPTKLRQ